MKYNDNGVIKDIIVKAGDTLPIGTIVEYDGTTIPAGYEEVPEEISIGLLNNFTFDSLGGRVQAPYLKRVGNIVFLKGILSLSTNIPTAETPAISIPAGYRPKGFTSFGALSNNNWVASSDICYIRCSGSQISVRNSSGNDYKLVHIDLSWVIED